MTKIKDIQPREVWSIFDQMLQIPRPSNHEDKIQDWAVNFGESLGLETIKDEIGNVIISKPATSGMENLKGVIFQGHLDMVPQKNSDNNHDFASDPIEAFIEDGWVTANGTTLGADNGIGVSSALAVLASKTIKHGPVEVLLTATEETGMDGAKGLKDGILKGDILLNTDTEDEGTFSIGCAGGIDVVATFKKKLTKKIPKNMLAFNLKITGLKGGHSGVDIHLGRGNANKVFFRILKEVNETQKVILADIQGGSLRNAIPREAFGLVVVKSKNADTFLSLTEKLASIVKAELKNVEPDLEIEVEAAEMPKKVFTKSLQKKLINTVWAAPNDVVRMSDTMQGTVETSSNLAIVQTGKKSIEVCCLVRSFSESAKMALASRLDSTFKLAGASVVLEGSYPGWQPNVESEILEVMKNLYTKQFKKEPELLAMHAGLECGILGSTYTKWDMISIGPTIKFPHSPDEKVNIETVQKYWDFLLNTLENIPAK
ncbi:MAG: aminoacyl-histidine dipeptidase [Prolixibacteraceae bacterium]|nr:aminoacyl-histidine dipeptidase [Prolixibacteraceae bacterium]MBT6766682.1 aminoacyl-histidine dipeptidase [Prolixibacteraceae bacterium]MBT6997243.1 aminoacyl-histidine dipeptidase [Prolixibacteraceae bacterium]MBT7396875.1 aminoacyl-histidine dipeptidase [Prolixibacteraceae bacterium]